MTIGFSPEALVGFVLVMTRLLAVFFVAPPFSGAMVPIRVRVALAGSIALIANPNDQIDLEILSLITVLTYQVVVGTILGYLISLLLSAPMIAGSMVDHLTGFSAAMLFDPFSQSSSSPAARFNQTIALVILVVTEGHLLIVRGVLRSYEAAPLSGLQMEALGPALIRGIGQLIVAAIEIALPVLAALLMAEVVLGLAARAAPRLNVMVVGFAVKSMVFVATFSLMLPLVVNSVSTLLIRSLRWGLVVSGAG